MKKIIALLLAVAMLLSMAACGTETPQNSDTQPGTSSTDAPATGPSAGTTEPSADATTPPESTDKPADYSYSIDLTGVTTLEELEARIEEHGLTVVLTVTGLNPGENMVADYVASMPGQIAVLPRDPGFGGVCRLSYSVQYSGKE